MRVCIINNTKHEANKTTTVKNHIRRPQMEVISKWTIVKIEKSCECHCLKVKNEKNTSKYLTAQN